ncbi:hypothetical protein HEK616_74840 (plasmid) [Streptomyces nigrescens]|uniref:Uncharacterized protein n=1 Tax=Streptomyces nigrescens TaxID=1920 RepID=A0ABN6R6F1_STRNI|nr:hypothetical protein HEK616_74840 [Streptomyces nigrescens]
MPGRPSQTVFGPAPSLLNPARSLLDAALSRGDGAWLDVSGTAGHRRHLHRLPRATTTTYSLPLPCADRSGRIDR